MQDLIDQLAGARHGLVTGDWSNYHQIVAETKAAEVRPGFVGRMLGIDPALIVQLVLLVLELVKQLRQLRTPRRPS